MQFLRGARHHLGARSVRMSLLGPFFRVQA